MGMTVEAFVDGTAGTVRSRLRDGMVLAVDGTAGTVTVVPG